jgi:hypothetical protein
MSVVPPKPKIARGKGAKTKQARKLKGSAVADLFGTSGGQYEDFEEVQADTVSGETQATAFAQSQSLYKPSKHSQAAESQNYSQALGRASAVTVAETLQAQANAKGKAKAPNKQTKKKVDGTDEEDASATEESDVEEEEVEDSGSMNIDAPPTKGAGNERQSLISRETPIQDFERLVEQGGHMTSTAFKQCEDTPLKL